MIEEQIKNKFKEYIDKFNDVSDLVDLCYEIIEIVEKSEDVCYNSEYRKYQMFEEVQ